MSAFAQAPRPPAMPRLVTEWNEEDEEKPRPLFVPDEGLNAWVHAHFLNGASPLLNTDHEHLVDAKVGYLWTNVRNLTKGKTVLGTAQLGKPSGEPWPAGMAAAQRQLWFRDVPDFIVTLYAPWAARADNAALLAVIDHELYHCAQKRDRYDEPKFTNEGDPIWTIRAHDVEQFVGVVARYGAKASMVEELVRYANREPLIARADIDGCCGVCFGR